MHAVDLPPRTVEPELGRRRHRWITGPSGFLLFLCGLHPVMPVLVIAPHIYGLLLGLSAAAHTPRGIRAAVDVMRVLTVLLCSILTVISFLLPPITLVAPLPALLVMAALGFTGRSERRAAATAIAIGALGIVWFGLFLDMYVATIASTGLMAGGLLWLCEVGYSRERGIHEVHHLARARARGRRVRLQSEGQ